MEDNNMNNEQKFNPNMLGMENNVSQEPAAETVVVEPKKKVGRPRGASSNNKVIKKEEKVSTSSSGYPGVSWNKRMCAWLAFFYDGASRRSRTFHPKHFNMDKEKARLAAVEFMKTVENNGRKKSGKGKGGRSKSKQLNDEHFNALHNSDLGNSMNGMNAHNNLHMQLMSMNPAFYMQSLNRNFNMSANERNNMFNSLNNHSGLSGPLKNMQDHNELYMQNQVFNNMHLLNNSNSSLNNNRNNNSNNNNNSSNSHNNSSNNLHYLNELIFNSNLFHGNNMGYHEGNVNTGVSDLLNLDDNVGLHNKDVENLMNVLFRQNYNMNMNISNIDKHYLQGSNILMNGPQGNNNNMNNSNSNNNNNSGSNNN
ncbi:hypothetical protein PFFVO_05306, partial [Plasmodium falciparum Vietnam Oak-Knoll (FVO)]